MTTLRRVFTSLGIVGALIGALGLWMFSDTYQRVQTVTELQQVGSKLEHTGFRLALLANDILLYDELRSSRQWQGMEELLRRIIADNQALLAPLETRTSNIVQQLDELRLLLDQLQLRQSAVRSLGIEPRRDEIYQLLMSQTTIAVTELQSALETFNGDLNDSAGIVLGTSQGQLLAKFALLCVLSTVFAGACWRIFSRRVLRPLIQIEHTIQQVACGNAAARVPALHDDEIGTVRRAFNDLLARQEYAAEAQAQANRALAEAKLNAEAASRTKSEFLANMSHEIRTPMNAVLGLLQLLRKTTLTPRQADYVSKADGAASALLAIINDILDFSKIEAGKFALDQQPFLLDRLLRNLSAVLSTTVRNKEIEVLFDLDPTLPQVLRGDGPRLQQVLLNLAGNGIKFTEHGEVILRIEALDVRDESVRVRFSVCDTGIGIGPDQLSRLFRAFEQAEASTNRRFGGTGLGLVISQRLIRLMGGQIEATSTLGRGSEFFFTIELGRDETTRAAERETFYGIDPARLTRPMHVLIVDDNESARTTIAAMVRSLGWAATTAESGAAALACLETTASGQATFDVVLIDWVMPDMDGWEGARRIRALYAGRTAPAIIMVTAHGRELSAEQAENANNPLDGLLTKPITPSMLFDAVSDATGGASAASRSSRVGQPAKRLQGLRILLVEDNHLNQQVAQELLSAEGAVVELADDGSECIDRIRLADPPYDAVLMDVQMPGIDGYEATHIVRKELGLTDLPIIAITANVMPADRARCLAAGMNAHVGKPIDLDEVVATVLGLQTRILPPPEIGQPAEEASSPRMPIHDGFDFAAALQRIGQRPTTLASAMRHFAADQQDVPDQLLDALEAGKRDDAKRLLHTLKGLAATLGADALAARSRKLETLVEDGIEAPALLQELALLRGSLEEAVEVFKQTAAALDPRPEPGEETSPLDAEGARNLLETMLPLLDGHNMRALDVFASLKTDCPAIVPRIGELDAAMENLDFATARRHVAELLKALD